jgi:hypothetical protein
VEEAHRAVRSPAIAGASGYLGRTGQRWAAGDLEVPKAVEIMIRLMLETGCEHPELLSWARLRVKGR